MKNQSIALFFFVLIAAPTIADAQRRGGGFRIVRDNQTYKSYEVTANSPGATLLSNCGLQQVPCGPPGLVVIYGPNSGVIWANPNSRVAAGQYAVNTSTLALMSQ